MCHTNKRYSRARFGILLIVIGLLWFAQKAGLFASDIFGPLILLTLGLWMIATSPLSCCGSQIRPDGDEAARQNQTAADNMLRPQGLSEQNHP